MRKAMIVAVKEWRDLRTQPRLLWTSLGGPLVFTLVAIVALVVAGSARGRPGFSLPAIPDLTPAEAAQISAAGQFRLLYLLLPLYVPTAIAAYGIVGEKVGRTLEPLLATSVSTADLLMGKALAALGVGLAVTWVSAALYVAAVRVIAVSDRVVGEIVSPGWLVLIVLASPFAAGIGIGLATIVSSRVSDPRTAQQISGLAIIPIVAISIGAGAGFAILTPALALAAAAFLAVLATAVLRIAGRLFDRESILTRWK